MHERLTNDRGNPKLKGNDSPLARGFGRGKVGMELGCEGGRGLGMEGRGGGDVLEGRRIRGETWRAEGDYQPGHVPQDARSRRRGV